MPPEFQELLSKCERVELVYQNFINLNKRFIDLGMDQNPELKPLADELNILLEQFKSIQKVTSAQKDQLATETKAFNEGEIDLSTFSRKLAMRTANVSDATFDLDMKVSPRLFKFSKKLAEPVIEATKAVQAEYPILMQEAKTLEIKMDEASKESNVVEKIDKTVSFVEKAIELGKKVYPVAKDTAKFLIPLAGLFL